MVYNKYTLITNININSKKKLVASLNIKKNVLIYHISSTKRPRLSANFQI